MASAEFSDSEIYEIEQILDHRKRGRSREYLIRWKGCDDDEDQWVKGLEIEGKDVIDEYESSLKRSTARKSTRKAAESVAKPKVVSQRSSKQIVKPVISTRSKKMVLIEESDESDIEPPDCTVNTFQGKRTPFKLLDTLRSRFEDYLTEDDTSFICKKETVNPKEKETKGNRCVSLPCISLAIYVGCLMAIVASFAFEAYERNTKK